VGKTNDKPAVGSVETAPHILKPLGDLVSTGGVVSPSETFGLGLVSQGIPTVAGRPGAVQTKYLSSGTWYALEAGIWLFSIDGANGDTVEFRIYDRDAGGWISMGTTDATLTTIFAPASGLHYRSPAGSIYIKIMKMGGT